MPKRRLTAKDIVAQKLDQGDEEIMDVALRPIQRFLRGNGWKRLPKGHPRYSHVEECWQKKLQGGKIAWMFEMPDSIGRRGSNPYGLEEPEWRFEVYSDYPNNPRDYQETTLSESPMLALLRAVMQRLSTWNRRQAGDPPGGSGPHTFF